MKTSDLFELEISYIYNNTIRKIVKETLDLAPECIQVIPSSSSGKYHPEYSVVKGEVRDDGTIIEGGLIKHIKSTVAIAKCLIDTEIFENMVECSSKIFKDYYESKRMYSDAVIASLILHDCCKPDETENHHTRFNHPLLAAKLFKEVANKYAFLDYEYVKMISPIIYKCIRSHMGQWNISKYEDDIVLPKPKSKVQWFVHLCDYLSSRKFIEFNFDKYYSSDTISNRIKDLK